MVTPPAETTPHLEHVLPMTTAVFCVTVMMFSFVKSWILR
jgi:hypothetical protein